MPSPNRRFQVMTWLALLNLAALRSPVAPSAYVTAPMLWLLALLAADVGHRYSIAIALGAAWALIMGPPPLPDRMDLVVVLLGQAVALALGIWILMPGGRYFATGSWAPGIREVGDLLDSREPRGDSDLTYG
jgi:hypothetical protein